jgi:cyclopropane fatty-acyl-phospholipid synthase-like methyltransferase
MDPRGKARGNGETLAMAEEAMLEMYTEKAGLGSGEGEGLRLLDLGCGWGSLGLYLAQVCGRPGLHLQRVTTLTSIC